MLGSIGQPYPRRALHRPRRRLAADEPGREPAAAGARPVPKLTDAIIATTDPEGCFNGAELGAWTQVRAAARLARLGCDAYAYAMVAAGTMDLVIEAGPEGLGHRGGRSR